MRCRRAADPPGSPPPGEERASGNARRGPGASRRSRRAAHAPPWRRGRAARSSRGRPEQQLPRSRGRGFAARASTAGAQEVPTRSEGKSAFEKVPIKHAAAARPGAGGAGRRGAVARLVVFDDGAWCSSARARSSHAPRVADHARGRLQRGRRVRAHAAPGAEASRRTRPSPSTARATMLAPREAKARRAPNPGSSTAAACRDRGGCGPEVGPSCAPCTISKSRRGTPSRPRGPRIACGAAARRGIQGFASFAPRHERRRRDSAGAGQRATYTAHGRSSKRSPPRSRGVRRRGGRKDGRAAKRPRRPPRARGSPASVKSAGARGDEGSLAHVP